MTSKENAERLFKHEQLSPGRSSIPEYEERALVERTKMAKLRALRLARDAESAPKPEETDGTKEKLARQKSSKTLRRRRAFNRQREEPDNKWKAAAFVR